MSEILLPSVQSLFIQMCFNGQKLSSGTAFIVSSDKGPLLLTNRHNVTGRDQNNAKLLSKNGGIPNEIKITHNAKDKLGNWIDVVEPILDLDGNSLWKEHPKYGEKADFVALPLTHMLDIDLYPYDLNNTGLDIFISPAEAVSVVGFPFGIQVRGSLAIWATGFIASEPEVDFDNLPIFLIDCRTRQGQSGSAVIAHRNGSVTMRHGGTRITGEPTTKFLGIYSGRINAESDIGIVWKASALKELIDSI